MKRMILCAGLLFSISLMTQAQTMQSKTTAGKKHQVIHKGTSKKKNKAETRKDSTSVSTGTTLLTNSGSNKAYAGPPFNNNQLTIQDPTIRALNARANGEPVNISSSGVVGMPKSAYGFANGHLLLRSTGATSIGTSTGSGSVGTGTTPGSVGTYGSVMGVNGKNPNAGNSIWGTAITGPDPRITDSTKYSGNRKN